MERAQKGWRSPRTQEPATNHEMKQPGQSRSNGSGEEVFPQGFKFWAVIVAVFAEMFLVSLDKLIISTAIPEITHTFHTPRNIGWYGSAYLLTNCAFQLFFGKLYKILAVKPLFLTSTAILLVGSLICGAAPTSEVFIFGRAIAGLGAGGVLPGIVTILVHTVPMAKRPRYMGGFGAIYGVASILGPTLGGVFTTRVTWRWCFYINAPICGVTIVLILLLLDLPRTPSRPMTLQAKVRQCDPLGTFFMVAGVVCLCIALEWGGMTYAWSAPRMIGLLVVASLSLAVFAAVQVWRPDEAILPPAIVCQRSIASGFWCSICIGAHQTIFLYYLPIWFQTVQGQSAIHSGLYLLAMAVPTAILSVVNGQLISRIGYYTPFLIVGSCICVVGSALFATLHPHTRHATWIGFLILYGAGLGFVSQVPSMAAQTVLPKEKVAIGSSMMFFGQTLFGAIFVSVGQNVLYTRLVPRLASTIPGITRQFVQERGITDLIDVVAPESRGLVLREYNEALRRVFYAGMTMAALGVLGSLLVEWKSVKKAPQKADRAGPMSQPPRSGIDGRHSTRESTPTSDKALAEDSLK